MKNSNQPGTIIFLVTLSMIMLWGFHTKVDAQVERIRESQSVSVHTTPEGKIWLKITEKKGLNKKTFEKTYDTYEEMKDDPGLAQYDMKFDLSALMHNHRNTSKFSFDWSEDFNSEMDSLADHSPFISSEDFKARMNLLNERMRGMMQGFGDYFRNLDSLFRQLHFRNENGKLFLNDEEFMDLNVLRKSLNNNTDSTHFFGNDDEEMKTVSKVKQVFVRSAKEEDKKAAQTAHMERLVLRDISFYPNPSDGKFDVSLETGRDNSLKVSIIDADGNEVYNITASQPDGKHEFKIDLSDQSSGIYILKVTQDNKALTKRIIIE